MANLTITAANIIPVDGYTPYDGIAGATITAGQPCYIDTADSNKLKLCEANGTAIQSRVKGISIHAALSGQPLKLITGGSLGFGAILTATKFYVVSATSGLIAPSTDLVSTDYLSILGYASTTSNLVLTINATEVLMA